MAMRRWALLLVWVLLAMMLTSGIALAKDLYGTDGKDRIIGTRKADLIDAKAGDDVVRGKRGSDSIWGGDGEDRLFGGPGNDRIHTGGNFPDVVDCGPGKKDWVSFDDTDQVVNCEQMEHRDPTALRESGVTSEAD